MVESEEELKMKVKEESEKSGLKLSIQKTKIMASGLISSWELDGKTMETVTDFLFSWEIPRNEMAERSRSMVTFFLLFFFKF